jgi:hypothetical protein
MTSRVVALTVVAVLMAGCGSSSSGGGGSGSSGGKGGPLSDESSCADWNAATPAQRKAYTAPLQQRAQRGNVFSFLRDTCEPNTDSASAQAIKLGPTISTIVGDQ